MLINQITQSADSTAAAFRKKLKVRAGISVFLTLTGLVAVMLIWNMNSGLDGLMAGGRQLSFLHGYYWGVGLGLTAAGLATFAKTLYLLRNQAAFTKRMLWETDERNRYISLRAWSWTGYVTLYALLLASFIVGRYSYEAALTLIAMLFGCGLIYGASYTILKRIN
jgi:predicted Co/Zn/Cd cation transporter (cation efflux family)